MLKKTALLSIFLFLICNCFGQTDQEKAVITSLSIEKYVNDFDDVLSSKQEVALVKSICSFELKTNKTIIVVTVKSIEPYENIFDFSLILAQNINFKCDVVIVLCNNLRKIQIQNNDRVIDKLTNEETKQIIEEVMMPFFKKEKYFKGLSKGISKIKKELQ